MKFRDLFGKDLGVWGNEKIDESKDNLGRVDREFVDVEDVPDHAKTPEEILMEKEKDKDAMLANDEALLPGDMDDDEVDKSLPRDPELVDKTPSQWKIDLDNGKYDGDTEERAVDDTEPTIIPSFKTQSIGIKSQLNELPREDIEERFNHLGGQTHNSKPQKPERDTIRLDEAV